MENPEEQEASLLSLRVCESRVSQRTFVFQLMKIENSEENQVAYKLYFYEDFLSFPGAITTIKQILNLKAVVGTFEVSPSRDASSDFDVIVAHEGYTSLA